MRLRVLVMSLHEERTVVGRFVIEAASIAALLGSGEISRRFDGRAYDSLTIMRDETAELTPADHIEVLTVQ